MNIEKIANMGNKWEKFLECHHRRQKECVIYGAGRGSDWVIRLLKTERILPTLIIDKNTGGGYKNSIPIINYKEFEEKYKNKKEAYIIVSSPKYEMEIMSILKKSFNEDDIFSFECELYYSYIHDIPGYREWILDCIDNCIGEDIGITHIKMDVERAELNALKGCEKTIKRCMPKLAICFYHRNEDFWIFQNIFYPLFRNTGCI